MPIDPSTAFISYSREDLEFVKKLAQDIRSSGVKIWMDKLDIRPGERWEAALETAAGSCSRLIVVLSPASVASQNVLAEASYALDDGKQVIPVLYRECKVPLRLRPLQYADFRGDYANGIRELLDALGSEQPQTPTAPSSQTPQVTAPAAAPKTPKLSSAPIPQPSTESATLVTQLMRRKWLLGVGAVMVIGAVVWIFSFSGGPKSGSEPSAGQQPAASDNQSQPQGAEPQRQSSDPISVKGEPAKTSTPLPAQSDSASDSVPLLKVKGEPATTSTPLSAQVVVKASATETAKTGTFDFNIWLEGSPQVLDQIASVEYRFEDPSFKNPVEKSTEVVSGFKVHYRGWGCMSSVPVTITPKGNSAIGGKTDFSMCHALGWK